MEVRMQLMILGKSNKLHQKPEVAKCVVKSRVNPSASEKIVREG